MAQNDQVSQEYLHIKCFLYKYTPEFNPQVGVTSSLSTFTPYSIDLDDTKYFTKYDISPFVTSYSFEQNIDETTYSWSVELQDLALSYGTINSKLKVKPPSGSSLRGGLSFSNSTDSALLLAEYETNANNIENNNDDTAGSSNSLNTINPIKAAKQRRGATPGPLTVQNTNLTTVLSTTPGLRLSDLIQEYDFISLYLYKNTTPLTNIWGTFGVAELQPNNNNPLQFFNYKVTAEAPPAFQNYQNPIDPYLQYESVLMTKMPNGQTLFSNEFNGFVMKKNLSSASNQVDRVTVAGNGWSRLFGSTRRAVKPSLFQNSLYQTGQVLGLQDVSAFETIYAGQPISNIIRDLFDLVYKIDFQTHTNTLVNAAVPTPVVLNPNNSTNLLSSTQIQSEFFASPLGNTKLSLTTSSAAATTTTPQLILDNSFYNITSLIVANAYPANLFNLPPYLLSTVMKLRPFAYIEPLVVPASDSFIEGAIASAAQMTANVQTGSQFAVTSEEIQTNDFAVQVPPLTFQQAIQSYSPSGQVINYGSTSPVYVETQVQNLTAYFQFLTEVFQAFSPQLQTPYEILDQIRSIAFVEIFEQPSGQFIVRSPQYNNMAASVTGRSDIAMIRSSNLNILSSNYGETVENLVTKLFTGYSPNITPISVLQQFGYCDGKLLIQNGLLEMTTAANPNTATASLTNTSTNNSKTTGIFGYAEYLMELSNAKLKTGVINCDLDNTIQVGQTFMDETHYKFGYVVSLSKHVAVAGTATMSFNLSYVRDAVPTYSNTNAITAINVDLLPVLTDIENSFASGS
jgi:hypothetical protein